MTRRRPAEDRTFVPPSPPSIVRRGPQVAQFGGWNTTVRGPARDQLGRQWRVQNHNWDHNAPWRANRTWWRGQPAFRLFTGRRLGYYFFPSYGYIMAPSPYRDHRWRAGEMLPSWFWRYAVQDYERYGLPGPPEGCAWIWLNGDVALVDLQDGYILDMVYNVW